MVSFNKGNLLASIVLRNFLKKHLIESQLLKSEEKLIGSELLL